MIASKCSVTSASAGTRQHATIAEADRPIATASSSSAIGQVLAAARGHQTLARLIAAERAEHRTDDAGPERAQGAVPRGAEHRARQPARDDPGAEDAAAPYAAASSGSWSVTSSTTARTVKTTTVIEVGRPRTPRCRAGRSSRGRRPRRPRRARSTNAARRRRRSARASSTISTCVTETLLGRTADRYGTSRTLTRAAALADANTAASASRTGRT